ncbi:MAG: zinc-binding dehydrogenase [Phycisphaerales bacterium JB043]
MLACCMRDQRPTLVEDFPSPELRDGELLVDMTHVAVTLRDGVAMRRHALGVQSMPDVLGHAGVGTIGDTNGQQGFVRGDRVAVWPDVICGTCDMCTGGLRWHCRSKKVMGLDGTDGVLRGCLGVVAECCVRLDKGISDDEALLCFPLASALQAARALGGGGSGHISVLGATAEAVLTSFVVHSHHPGARLLSASESALDACEKLGVPHRDIRDAGRREDQDIVIDCTASARGLATALELVRPGGRVVLVASPPSEPFDLAPIVDREVAIEGCKAGSLQAAIDMVLSGGINLEGLITSRVAMRRAPEAFERVFERGQLQVVVDIA